MVTFFFVSLPKTWELQKHKRIKLEDAMFCGVDCCTRGGVYYKFIAHSSDDRMPGRSVAEL